MDRSCNKNQRYACTHKHPKFQNDNVIEVTGYAGIVGKSRVNY